MAPCSFAAEAISSKDAPNHIIRSRTRPSQRQYSRRFRAPAGPRPRSRRACASRAGPEREFCGRSDREDGGRCLHRALTDPCSAFPEAGLPRVAWSLSYECRAPALSLAVCSGRGEAFPGLTTDVVQRVVAYIRTNFAQLEGAAASFETVSQICQLLCQIANAEALPSRRTLQWLSCRRAAKQRAARHDWLATSSTDTIATA